jgi:hypothetical protein
MDWREATPDRAMFKLLGFLFQRRCANALLHPTYGDSIALVKPDTDIFDGPDRPPALFTAAIATNVHQQSSTRVAVEIGYSRSIDRSPLHRRFLSELHPNPTPHPDRHL